MTLYLVQHGQSLSEDVDPDQGLSENGVAETERIAGVANGKRSILICWHKLIKNLNIRHL